MITVSFNGSSPDKDVRQKMIIFGQKQNKTCVSWSWLFLIVSLVGSNILDGAYVIVAQSGVTLRNPILSGPGNSKDRGAEATNLRSDAVGSGITNPQQRFFSAPKLQSTPRTQSGLPLSNPTQSVQPIHQPNPGVTRNQNLLLPRGLNPQKFRNPGRSDQQLDVEKFSPSNPTPSAPQSLNRPPLVQPAPYSVLPNQNMRIPNQRRQDVTPRFSIPNPTRLNPNGGQGSQGLTGQSIDASRRPALPAGTNGVEVVRERYNNGAVRIERQVILDQNKNYVNHGYWKFFLPNGRVAAQADFENGRKTGSWSRWLTPRDVTLVQQPPFNQFQAPFLSTFQYENDALNGTWKLTDSANRTVFEIHLANGKRDSVCTWYLVNGQKFQEIHYKQGVLDGTFMKWNLQGKLVENRKFVAGREIGNVTEFYRPGAKKLEYGVLAGKVEPLNLDNPWNLEFANEKKIGTDIKNGAVTAWYPNGQVQFQGQYKNDTQEGNFTWYYETGQKQAEGSFLADQRSGVWIWWHENGMRASVGNYADGLPAGNWQWWLADGKLSKTKSFDAKTTNGGEQMQNASFRDKK